jgi:dipeptidyl aminopeptidase/acylaminoacyl peptidase
VTAIAPYGSWKSPIGASVVARSWTGPVELQSDGEVLWWLEQRPMEDGRQVACRRGPEGRCVSMTPPGFSVRTRVHEYGGGAYLAHNGTVWFSNFSDQRVYHQAPGGDPKPVSLSPTVQGGLRYADFRLTPDGAWLICVRERHLAGEGAEVVNDLVAMSASGDSPAAPLVLASGRDFYAAPRLSPDGRYLAWLSWDHPNMPWDGTELWIADIELREGTAVGRRPLREVRRVAGGPAESVCQPAWDSAGGLYFISDRSGWWNLYLITPGSPAGAEERAEPLAPMAAEFTIPQWWFGSSNYAILPDGRIASAYWKGAIGHLGLIEPGAGKIQPLAMDASITSFGSLCESGGKIACIVGGPATSPAVAMVDPDFGAVEILHHSRELEFDPRFVSMPRAVEFSTSSTDQPVAHAVYYSPTNPDYTGPAGERPPLVVMAHGGPTGQANTVVRLDIQYFTSQGLAVVDVDYRGSSGYGRAYRQSLYGRCGTDDVADCVAAARYLVAVGAVDGRRLAIRGGSAGGYIALCALTFYDDFAAGASYFGIADVEALAHSMHKFESRYISRLVGGDSETRRTRSPINFTQQLSCPVILLQGLDDPVVPPSQANAMTAVLEAKQIPYAYLGFEGEQHGFRRAENLQQAVEAELFFYGAIFGFDLADPLEPVEIHGLPSANRRLEQPGMSLVGSPPASPPTQRRSS